MAAAELNSDPTVSCILRDPVVVGVEEVVVGAEEEVVEEAVGAEVVDLPSDFLSKVIKASADNKIAIANVMQAPFRQRRTHATDFGSLL